MLFFFFLLCLNCQLDTRHLPFDFIRAAQIIYICGAWAGSKLIPTTTEASACTCVGGAHTPNINIFPDILSLNKDHDVFCLVVCAGFVCIFSCHVSISCLFWKLISGVISGYHVPIPCVLCIPGVLNCESD